MRYRQLTLDDRYQIQALRKQGLRQADIARSLGRPPSTISRELARNMSATNPYLATCAQNKTAARRVAKGKQQRLIQGDLKVLVEQKLRLGWSPEQVSGRLWDEQRIRLCHETIYQHVLRDTHDDNGVLRYCLRFGGYKHNRCRKSKRADRTKLRKNHISQRPAEANERLDIGHWERDCIVGSPGGEALLTIVDRKSRYTRIRKVPSLSSAPVGDATVDALRGLRVETMTNDNGHEFGGDEKLAKRLRAPIYFCDPSSPWQRGSIENLNGLIRQYARKGSRIEGLHPRLPAALEDTLNHRPRKTLGFRTPHEVFFDTRTKLMSGPMMRLGLEFNPCRRFGAHP